MPRNFRRKIFKAKKACSMFKIINAALISVPLILVSGCSSMAKESLPGCAEKAPPKNSFVLESHGVTLLVFPEKIEEKYTGCKKIWFATGELFGEIKFHDGEVTFVEVNAPDKTSMKCEFHRDGLLKEGDAKKCLPREKWLQ
ncbi:hypothetical protein [Variovorax paradoxus]|uniref:hypothetical protein n=1 Tax=Variovorax paradoxus TaxID=34073 RepID=UPI0027D8A94C|nr:hypothetical protein [Variovorax paradoxus]